MGQYNLPTLEQHDKEVEERIRLARMGATATPAPAIPQEPGLRSREGKPPATTFTDGYWGVGTDIFPGEYFTMGPPIGRQVEYPCTFARLRTLEGKIDDPGQVIEIVDIWLPPKNTMVTIEPTDGAVYSSNCQKWRHTDGSNPEILATVEAHRSTVPSPFGSGDYERDAYYVGREIAPELYRTEGPKMRELGPCVFALMTRGGTDPLVNARDVEEVIEVWQVIGPAEVTIDSPGFFTFNCQEWRPAK